MEIEKTFGSVAAATPAVVAEYNAITAAVARATTVTREMVVAMAEQRAQLTVAGQQFTGFTTAFERALPQQRQMIAEWALGITALTMGWQMGRRIGESIGVEYAAWDESAKNVTGTISELVHHVNDVFAASMNVVQSISQWDFSHVKTDLKDLMTSVKDFQLWQAQLLHIPGAAAAYEARQKELAASTKTDIYQYPSGGQFSDPTNIYNMLAVMSKQADDAAKEAADTAAKIVGFKVQELEIQKQLIALGVGSDIDKKVQTETLDYAKTRLQLTAELAKAEADKDAVAISNINTKMDLEKQLHALRVKNNAWDLLVAKETSTTGSLQFAGGVPSITSLMMAMIAAQTGQPLPTSPWMSGQAPGGNPMTWIPGMATMTPGMEPAAKSFAQKFTEALGQAMSESKFKQSVGGGVSAALNDLFTSGGHNIGQALAGSFRAALGGEIQRLVQDFFPHVGNQQGQDPNQLYIGKSTTPTGAGGRALYSGVAIAESGIAGYQAGLSGQPGSRTSSVLGGAAEAASLYATTGNIYVAAAAFIASAIGSYLGAAAHRADYQYGIPGIDKQGIATFTQDRNLTDPMIAQIKAQVQAEYDQIHDSLINLLVKFPNIAIPSIAEISGKFQDNPSAHWGEHLQQWITGTLPKQLISALGDELSVGFSQLGMSQVVFKKMFDFLGGLDPAKAVALLNTLADALKSLFGATGSSTFFHADPMGLGGSGSYLQGMMDITAKAGKTPGQLLAEQDAEIIKLVGSLKSLSPEGQIAQIAQIAALEKQRYDTEKAAIQAIYDVARATKDMMQSARDTLGLQLLVKADGTPDFAAQAAFFKNKAQGDLANISGATNAADVQKFFQQFINDIMQAEQLGIQGGGNLKDWNKWATDQLPKGQSAVDAELNKLGVSIDTANNLFNAQVDPALAAFTGTVDGTNVVIGQFGTAVTAVIQPMNDFGAAIVNLTNLINSKSGFASRTVAQRLSA